MTTTDLKYHQKIPEKTFEVDVKSCSGSVFSDDSTSSTLLEDNAFQPGSTFYIAARGIGVWRFPLPSSELEIPIYRNDGSLAYTSTREKRSSGNCVLNHPKIGDLVSTTYFFGPNCEPILNLLQAPGGSDDEANAIKIKGKWTSRSTSFVMGDGRVFEWSYAHTKDKQGKKVNLVVLRQQEQSEVKSKGKKKEGRILAQLVRGEETRAEGSKSCTAGNGGQLVLDQDATSCLDEAVIVATCLMMLKKEIDRRRFIQIMVLSGAASGGP